MCSEMFRISCLWFPDNSSTEVSTLLSDRQRAAIHRLCTGYFATGATLGVMAIVLIFFLFLLCLPWSKCRRCRRCLGQRTPPPNPRESSETPRLETFTGGYPISILDIFPPYMLPKLPDYQQCLEEGVLPRPDEVPPPATPPPLSEQPRAQAEEQLDALHITDPATRESILRGVTMMDSQTPPPAYSERSSVSGLTVSSVRGRLSINRNCSFQHILADPPPRQTLPPLYSVTNLERVRIRRSRSTDFSSMRIYSRLNSSGTKSA
ncbi:unnamed protein product [Calicophoron daubneyi]|uniref:Uncharacterized protein n=1 Tax=Calicophoron daubneyi TaxID=300641 RepID=A0AAV2TZM0_CALDB